MESFIFFAWTHSNISLKTELTDFLGKNLVLSFLGQKGPKWVQNEVFKFYEKSVHGIFLIFCLKLQQHKVLKLVLVIFWEKSCFEDSEPKGSVMGSKWGFSVYEKSVFRNFLSFCIKLQQYISLKLTLWNFFEKLLFWGFLPKRGVKWAQNESFHVLLKTSAWFFAWR